MKNHLRSLGVALAVAAAALMSACTRIDTGNVGVESTLGQVKAETLPAGNYLTLFKTIVEIDGKEIAAALNDLKPKSQEQLTMADFDVDIYYRIDPTKAAQLMTRFTGDVTEGKGADLVGHNYFMRQARVAVFTVAERFKAAEMNGKRADIEAAIAGVLQKELDKEVGKGWYVVGNVNVKSIVADKSLEESIQASARTTYEISRKSQEVELAKQEANRKEQEALGIAKANRIIAESLTPTLVRLKEIEAQQAFAKQGTHTVLLPQGGSNTMVQVGK